MENLSLLCFAVPLNDEQAYRKSETSMHVYNPWLAFGVSSINRTRVAQKNVW